MAESKIMRKFSRKQKLFWASASFGGAIISNIYGATLQYFYHVYMNLGASWIALSAIMYAVWNAVNDPLFGFWSDRSRSKKGRRIPFMRYSAPFLGLTFILVWLVPIGFDQIGIFIWMLVTMALYDTFYTIIFLVYSALLPEITEDENERGSLQTYASLLSLVGMILGFVLPEILRPHVGQTDLFPFYIGMMIIGIVGAILILITTYKFKERPEFTQIDIPLGLKDSLKYTFKSKSFIILVSANFMSIFMQQLLLSHIFYLADYVMQVSSIFLYLCVIIGLIVGTFVANILAGKLGVVKANQLLLVIGSIPLMLIFFVDGVIIYLFLIVAGFGLSGPLVLTNVLFAQVCDEDEIRTGVRREAAFFGVNALITKPAQSLSLIIGPSLLTIAGFLTSATGEIILPQPTSALLVIKALIGLIPGILVLIGAIILILYPLKGDYLKEVKQKILDIHAEKELKLKEIQSKNILKSSDIK